MDTPSRAAAAGLLADGGTVLDVGCGGGAATFALDRATAAVGVDRQRDMLDLFAAAARPPGAPHRTVAGTWPDVAASAGRAGLVVCHHVLHDVVDLPPFLVALTAAAGRGVVVRCPPSTRLRGSTRSGRGSTACAARRRPQRTTRWRCSPSRASGRP